MFAAGNNPRKVSLLFFIFLVTFEALREALCCSPAATARTWKVPAEGCLEWVPGRQRTQAMPDVILESILERA